jgi:hypothetical protein
MAKPEIEVNQLQIIVQESGLEKTKADIILDTFKDYFKIASEWEKKAKAIEVTSETQTAEMRMAREGRLFLREKRIAVEKTRKELKEQALREGKAIDGIANVLKGLIEPIEEYLDRQERFVEIRDDEIKTNRLKVRTQECTNLQMDPLLYDLYNMAEDKYKMIIEDRKLVIKQRMEEDKRMEEERLKQQQENERLRKEVEEKENLLKAEREKADADRKVAEETQRKEREEQEKKLRKEREEKERLEAELRKKQEAEEAEKKQIEAKKVKALKAPDKQKLIQYAEELSLVVRPNIKDAGANKVLQTAVSQLNNAIIYLRTEAAKL